MSVKSQIINILGFASYVSVASIQLCHCSMKSSHRQYVTKHESTASLLDTEMDISYDFHAPRNFLPVIFVHPFNNVQTTRSSQATREPGARHWLTPGMDHDKGLYRVPRSTEQSGGCFWKEFYTGLESLVFVGLGPVGGEVRVDKDK